MSAMGPELERGTNSYAFIFSKTWQVVSVFIMAPIPNCCFLNMTHTYNFFYFTQALSKNYNPYSKIYWIPLVENVSVLLIRSKIPRLGMRIRLSTPHTTLDRLILQGAPQRVNGYWFPAILRVPLGVGLHKQSNVSQKCGRGPQAVCTLSPHPRWHLPHDIVSEAARAGALLHGSANLILSEILEQS